MSVKSAVLAVAAALTLAGGAIAAGALPATAATPACGPTCIDLFPARYAFGGHPLLVLDSLDQGEVNGTPIVLDLASDTNRGEDFTIDSHGSVDDYYQAGLVSLAFDEQYAHLTAMEIEYSPYDASTGECVGVPAAAGQGTSVSLQPCGVSGKTIWIVDSRAPIGRSPVPLINASGSATTPHVLSLPAEFALPGLLPGRFLATSQLQTAQLSSGASRLFDQEWSADSGVLTNVP